jgi:hypothetical protein
MMPIFRLEDEQGRWLSACDLLCLRDPAMTTKSAGLSDGCDPGRADETAALTLARADDVSVRSRGKFDPVRSTKSPL